MNLCFHRDLPESIYFYTFHKCASTLFSSYILKNIEGLLLKDYASQIYFGKVKSKEKIIFHKNGFVYGPIRLSAGDNSSEGELLINPTTDHHFLRSKTALFFVRDPRDILVSDYYSSGFTHEFSKVSEIADIQRSNRQKIRGKTLDEFALDKVDRQVDLFKKMHNLSSICKYGAVLRYEDMVDNFDFFAKQLCRYITISDKVVKEIYMRSRPRSSEDASSHCRSGQVQGFRNKLKESTIEAINLKLRNTLTLFGYKA